MTAKRPRTAAGSNREQTSRPGRGLQAERGWQSQNQASRKWSGEQHEGSDPAPTKETPLARYRAMRGVLQREPRGDINSKTKTKYEIEFDDAAGKFKEAGEDPAGVGITGVKDYSASVNIGKNQSGNGDTYNDSVSVDASTHEYHQGHLLASGLGGSGNAYNIFEQDGGQNTTGAWPSFERSAGSQLGTTYSNQPMKYKVVLKGTNLQYNF